MILKTRFFDLYGVLNFEDLEEGKEPLHRAFSVYNPKLSIEIKKDILESLGAKVKECNNGYMSFFLNKSFPARFQTHTYHTMD